MRLCACRLDASSCCIIPRCPHYHALLPLDRFRATDIDADAEYDYDGGVELTESRAKRGSAEQQRQRDRARQVAELRRGAAAENSCTLCISGGLGVRWVRRGEGAFLRR